HPVADPRRRERGGPRTACGGRTHGLHQLFGDVDRHDDDLLWLWPRPVRQRWPRGALSLLHRHVGGDASLVQTVARALSLWAARMAVAQLGARAAAADAPAPVRSVTDGVAEAGGATLDERIC